MCGKRWDLPKFVEVLSVNLGFSRLLTCCSGSVSMACHFIFVMSNQCVWITSGQAKKPASRIPTNLRQPIWFPGTSWHNSLANSGYGDGSFSMFSGSPHRPIPVRCNWIVSARKMHSTTGFAMTVLRMCVTHVGSARCLEPSLRRTPV